MNQNQALQLIHQTVRALKPYHLEPEEAGIKINQNENPWDWPSDVKETVADFCRERPWNRYPDFIPTTLKQRLAEYTGTTQDSIIVGNGSNEILLVLLLSLLQRDKPVIISQPTFTVYRILASGLGASERSVLLRPDLSFDTNQLIACARENPGSLMILCSPNNPTGSTLSEKEIRDILDVHQGFLILDQAYVEFGGYNAIELIKEYPNLIVTRTFSKAMGGAGLRLGYLVGDPVVVLEINKIKLPYNINFFTERTALALLANRQIAQERVKLLVEERDRLLAFLAGLRLEACYPSAANFILIRTSRKASLFSFLKSKKILIRDVSSYPLLENCLRISIGTPDENRLLQSALGEFFQTAGT